MEHHIHMEMTMDKKMEGLQGEKAVKEVLC